MNKKHLIGGIIVFALIGVFVIVPGGALFTDIEGNCELYPYSSKCFCDMSQRRIYVPWTGIPKWACEDVELLILDPESPTFETDAIDFTRTYLTYYCDAVCTDLSCSDGDIAAVYGYNKDGNRIANIECVVVTSYYPDGKPATGHILWRMEFFVESPTDTPMAYSFSQNYCVDPDITTRCEPEMDIIPDPFAIFKSYQTIPPLGSGLPPAVR